MNTHYFKLHFTGFTTGESKGLHYLRLVTGKHVFYTDKRYFDDRSLFQRLKINTTLYIGAHRLKDGTYWIHWMTDGEVMLEPKRSKNPFRSPFLKSFFSAAVCAISGYLTQQAVPVWLMLIFAMVAVFSLGIAGYQLAKLCHCIALKRHKGMRDLIEKMELARQCNYVLFQLAGETLTDRQHHLFSLSPTVMLPARYAIIKESVARPEFAKWTTGTGKYRRDYHGFQFQCAGETLSLSWLVNDFNLSIHPIFKHQCQPFLAEDDSILAIYHKDSRQVDILHNAADGRIYLKRNAFYITDRAMASVYIFFHLIMAGIILISTPLFYFNEVGAFANWDWWKYGDFMLDMVVITFLCSNLFLGLMELVNFVARYFSSRINDWVEIQKITKKLKSTSGIKPVHQELP